MTVTQTNSEGLSGICRMDLQEQSPSTEQEQQASVVVHHQWETRLESAEDNSIAAGRPERRKEFRNSTDPRAYMPQRVQAWHQRLQQVGIPPSAYSVPVKHVGWKWVRCLRGQS